MFRPVISARSLVFLLSLGLPAVASAATLAEQVDLGRFLHKSIRYWEHQVSGTKPAWNRTYWRGNAQTTAGSDNSIDLTGGWNDAGDNVKFNFPQAHALTILAWTYLEYRTALGNARQDQHLLNQIRWGADYLVKCHPSANVIWAQVGHGSTDHTYWKPPEQIDYWFPSFKIDAASGGTDLACEFAAAFAACSLVFKDLDATYSASLLQHARDAYNFGSTYRKKYSETVTDAASFYNSSSYQDELAWGACWLARATGESAWLDRAKSEFTPVQYPCCYSLAWENKSFHSTILLWQLTGDAQYKTKTEAWIDSLLPGASGRTYTPGGLLWLQQFGPAPLAVSGAWGALLYTRLVGASGTGKYTSYRNWAFGQMGYLFGSNPQGRDYICGLTDNSVVNFHHRAASGIIGYTSAYGTPSVLNTYTLEGAVAGGPASDDSYGNNRNNPNQTEAGVPTNAYVTAMAAALCEEFQIAAPAPTTIPGTVSAPTIDGVRDASYGTAQTISRTLVGTAGAISGSWSASHDGTNLYLHVAVNDAVKTRDSGSTAYQDDSVELYIDRRNAKDSTYGAASSYGNPDVFQYTVGYNDAAPTVSGINGSLSGIVLAWTTSTDGYMLELKIPWSTIGGARAVGDEVGFDVHLNDDDNGGERDAKASWAATSDVAWRRPDVFGTVKLGAATAPPVSETLGAITAATKVAQNVSYGLSVPYSTLASNRRIAAMYFSVANKGASNESWTYRTGIFPTVSGQATLNTSLTIPADCPIGDGAWLAQLQSADGLTVVTQALRLATTFAADPSRGNFETGTNGWAKGYGSVGTPDSSDARQYAGARSLRIPIAKTTTGSAGNSVALANPAQVSGKTVTYRIWVPNHAAITAVQPYYYVASSNTWVGNYVTALTKGGWTQVTLAVPSSATPSQLGIEVVVNGSFTGDCHLDAVNW